MNTKWITTTVAAGCAVLALTGCHPGQGGTGQDVPGRSAVEHRQAPDTGQPEDEPAEAEASCDENGRIVHYAPHTPAGRRYAERFCSIDYAGMFEDGLRKRGITSFGG